MTKLSDYSGEPIPNLELTDFSYDTLVELLKLYSRFYMALDGFWYLSVKERVNNEEALACDINVWEKMGRYELSKITRLLNIQGNDVAAFVKGMQISPWFRVIESKFELSDHNNATLTITNCPTLNALEKEGEGRENQICNIVEPKVFKDYASFFNPDIEVKCLQSPPRKSRDGFCCQWQFTLAKRK